MQKNYNELAKTIEDFNIAFSEFSKKNNQRHDELQNRLDDFELQANDLRIGPNGSSYMRNKANEAKAVRCLLQGDAQGFRETLNYEGPVFDQYVNLGSVGDDPGGGYSVMPHVQEGITKILRNGSPMRGIVGIETFSDGDAFEELFAVDGSGADWVGETGSRPETTLPDMQKLRVPIHEIYAAPKVTQCLLDDSSIDIVNWIADQVGTAFAEKEDTAFVVGDGVGKPRGFLSYTAETADDGSRTAWPVLQYVPTGAAGAFASTDPADALVDLIHKIKAGYRQNSVWLMNRATAGVARKIKDGQGNYLWQQSLQSGDPSLLLGHSVILDENMTDIAADSFSIAFGDFRRGYKVAEKVGVKFLRDPFTDKPNVIFYSYKRLGGDVRDFNAIKLLKFSAS